MIGNVAFTGGARLAWIDGIVIALTAFAVFLTGVTKPHHNWDIIGYVAAAYHRDGLTGQPLHNKTYSDIRAEVDPATFDRLIDGAYRRGVFDDPRALEQQLPFYSIKPIYVELIRAGGRSGLSYAQATYWVSALCSALCIVVLGLFAYRIHVSILVIPLVAVASGIVDVARHSVPDAPAHLLGFLAVLFALERNRFAFVVSALLPLARTDYLLLSAPLMLHQYRQGLRTGAVISLIGAAIAYACVNAFFDGYSWLTVFNFNFISGSVPYPAEMPIFNHAPYYVWPYVYVWDELVHSRHFVIYCLAIFVMAYQVRRRESSPELCIFFVIPFLYLGLHLALFPHYEDRFFVVSASLNLLGLFTMVRQTERAYG